MMPWTIGLTAQSTDAARAVVDHTPAWLAFVGAVLVSTIAAVTAQLRQSQQLRHDRELKDLEELRALLDECASMAGSTSQLMTFMLNRASSLPRKASRVEAASEGRPMLLRELGVELEIADDDYSAKDPAFQSIEDSFFQAAEPVFSLYQRIVLRLGEAHPVSQSFLRLQMEWVAMGLSALLAETDPDSDERTQGIAFVRSELRDAHFAFLFEANMLVESRIGKRALEAKAAAGGETDVDVVSTANADDLVLDLAEERGWATATADIDSDGRDELLVAFPVRAGSALLKVYGYPEGAYGAEEFSLSAMLTADTPAGFTVGDLDGDGRTEVATVQRAGEDVEGVPVLEEILYRWRDGDFSLVQRERVAFSGAQNEVFDPPLRWHRAWTKLVVVGAQADK